VTATPGFTAVDNWSRAVHGPGTRRHQWAVEAALVMDAAGPDAELPEHPSPIAAVRSLRCDAVRRVYVAGIRRCPDGGGCHGPSPAVTGQPCPDGACYRVRMAGPLSGVFPGDRWPDAVLAAHGITPAQE
jgi:hypothetical protein